MKRLNAFVNAATTLVTAVVLFITASIDAARKLPGQGQPYGVEDFLLQLFIALLGATAIILFERLVRWVIAKWRTLRRVIVGQEDIEGYWLETMIDTKSGNMSGWCVEFINYDDGRFVVAGKQFDLTGKYTGSYWTVMHQYANYESKLVFGSKHVGDPGAEKSGYSVVHYMRPETMVTSYVGYYTDTDMPGRIDITGQRLGGAAEIDAARSVLENGVLASSDALRRLRPLILSVPKPDLGLAAAAISADVGGSKGAAPLT